MNRSRSIARSLGDGFRRLRLADAAFSWDPNSRIVSAADTVDGIAVTMTGGWSATDVGSAFGWAWRAVDVFGRIPSSAKNWQFIGHIIERTAFGLSDDVAVVIGFGDMLDPTSTIDGLLGGLVYTAGARRTRSGDLRDGVAANTDSTGNANIRNVQVNGDKYATGNLGRVTGVGLNAANAYVNIAPVTTNGIAFAPSTLGVFFGYMRTATTAGNVSGVHDPSYGINRGSSFRT